MVKRANFFQGASVLDLTIPHGELGEGSASRVPCDADGLSAFLYVDLTRSFGQSPIATTSLGHHPGQKSAELHLYILSTHGEKES